MDKKQSDWRDWLTDEERAIIERADRLKAEWRHANAQVAGIMNRAVKRAWYDRVKRARVDGAER